MIEIPSFPVAIHCITYNHAFFIENAMDGFVMQQTTFPFVAIIVDDFSSDGEPTVIETYYNTFFDRPNIIENGIWETDEARFLFGQHKENKNCYFAIVLLKSNYYRQRKSKKYLFEMWERQTNFIALCEGDDYWTNSDKLQKQVDFLEAHADYTMCFHRAIEHCEDGTEEDHIFSTVEDRDYSGPEIFDKWTIATASVLLRKSVFNSEIYQKAIVNPKFMYGDIILFLCCCHCGKIWGISIPMCVYRRHAGGMTASFFCGDNQLRLAYHCLEVYHVFGEKYKKTSISKFFKEGVFFYFNSKETLGSKKFILLFDLLRIAPMQTASAFKDKIRDKVHIRKVMILTKMKKWKS